MSNTKTLTLNGTDARKYYPTADQAFKAVLESTFGRDFFSQKIQDRVGSYEDACEVLGINPDNIYNTSYDSADEIAHKKLKVIIRTLNEGWTPDWSDENQEKWYCWFIMKPTGFSLSSVRSYFRCSDVPSRLCFKSAELAKYAAAQFLDLYKTYMLK